MSNKPLADRILAVQQYCIDGHMQLGLELDSDSNLWRAWDDQEQLTDGCDSFEEMIETLEAEFGI